MLVLALLLRAGLGLQPYITDDDIDLLGRLFAAAALACGYFYATELAVALL